MIPGSSRTIRVVIGTLSPVIRYGRLAQAILVLILSLNRVCRGEGGFRCDATWCASLVHMRHFLAHLL